MRSSKCFMISSPDAEGADDGQHADHENPGVNSDASCLQTRPKPAQAAGKLGAAIHEQAVDYPGVDETPEKVLRDGISRMHDDAIVALVHVILLGQDFLEPRFGR